MKNFLHVHINLRSFIHVYRFFKLLHGVHCTYYYIWKEQVAFCLSDKWRYYKCKSLLHVHVRVHVHLHCFIYLNTLLDGARYTYYNTSNKSRFVSQTNDSIITVKASHMYMYILTVSIHVLPTTVSQINGSIINVKACYMYMYM